jgi:hypothetical protein
LHSPNIVVGTGYGWTNFHWSRLAVFSAIY